MQLVSRSFGFRIGLVVVFTVCAQTLFGQRAQLQTRNGQRFPTVVFSSVRWDANPPSYSIAIDSTGAATYQSAPESLADTGVAYTVLFQASDSTRRTVFALVRSLNFFRDELPISVGSPQNTRVNTIGYHDLTFSDQITYSETSDSELDELTSIVEDISTTFEFARRLAYFRDHDRRAIGSELEAMQKDAQRHHLREVQAVAPVLRGIASDQSLDATVRRRADEILTLFSRTGGGGGQRMILPSD